MSINHGLKKKKEKKKNQGLIDIVLLVVEEVCTNTMVGRSGVYAVDPWGA
jgi:hypothetical protein